MPKDDRFKQSVVATLARRAANRCSNPDCSAITSGPADDRTRAVNVGYAAHIYGANPGSARYDPNMAASDRSDITNAIWLCGNCHKLVDDDPIRFPAGLLFEWQRAHERQIGSEVGKVGAELRARYERRHLEEFGKLSYVAERILIEKAPLWEYRLTAEVLRYEMAPVLRRWAALKRGLYLKRNELIDKFQFSSWMSKRQAELGQIVDAFSELMNVEFARAWGEPGVAGIDIDIVETCRLMAEMCSSALAWEELVRFTQVDVRLEEVRRLYFGVAGNLIDEAAKVPEHLGSVFREDPQPGTYNLTITLGLPDGWAEAITAAYEEATNAILSGRH